jgi:hypothetical protein
MATLLRATSPTSIVIGPFVSTGATAQTAIEVSSATIVDLYKITAKSDITTTTAGANSMAHVANGYYSIVLTSGNTDTVGPLMITADSTGSMSVWGRYQVIPAAIYDSLMTGTVTLDSTFANGAQASSLLAMGVSVSSSLVRITACGVADASSLVWIQSAHANIVTLDTVADAIKVDTASSLAKVDIIDTVVDSIKVDTASSLVWIASAHTNIGTMRTVVDSVKVETASSLAKIDIIDTVVDSIKVETASSLVWIASTRTAVSVASVSAMTNLAYGSSLSAVKVDTASSLVWIASAHANIVTMDAVVDSVKVDTASSLVWIASAHANIVTMDAVVDTVKIDTASALVNIALLPTAAIINAQVLDVLNVDTFAEPGQGAPAATASVVGKIGYVYKFLRNKITTTSTLTSVYADNGTTVDQKATVGDDGTTFTRDEFGTGA